VQELGLSLRNHLSSPVALLALFLLVTGIPLVTVVRLGSWRLLDQDRALENQRVRERLEEGGIRFQPGSNLIAVSLQNTLPTDVWVVDNFVGMLTAKR
jgi:hypothetical protein